MEQPWQLVELKKKKAKETCQRLELCACLLPSGFHIPRLNMLQIKQRYSGEICICIEHVHIFSPCYSLKLQYNYLLGICIVQKHKNHHVILAHGGDAQVLIKHSFYKGESSILRCCFPTRVSETAIHLHMKVLLSM